jgi:DNA helicase II / ATP-dependent DNA helicase PcrA
MSQLLENLNQEQLKAVTHVGGPLLIVAGAGTGKTTVITRRIAYLVQQKLAKPDEILSLTFTDKAAGEMEERVDQLVPLGSFDFWISTFHSFGERLLKQHGLDIGLANDFKLLDKTQQWLLIYKNFDKFKLDYYKPLGSPNRFIDGLIDHFSKCKDEMVTPHEYLDYAQHLELGSGAHELPIGGESDRVTEIKRIQELASAYHTYQRLLLDNEYLDFGDLIHYAIGLFKERPNLLAQYQKQFKYIMVDEFQDTNVAQYELIKLLAGKEKNLVVVGDDDQSIYKFRGASVSNILKLKKDFPEIQSLTLVDNYRSSQKILDLAYEFIQSNNPNRLEAQLGIDKRLKGHNKDKTAIQVLEGKDLSEELNLVTEQILKLKTDFPETSWNDFAILIRANSAAEEILPRLEARQIPYSFVANRGLYKKPLIADLINYMKLLDNYHESASLYRVLNFPKFRLNPFDSAQLTQFTNRKTISLYEALQNKDALQSVSEAGQKKIHNLLSHLDNHTKLTSEKSAVELFVQLIRDLEIDVLLEPDTLENAQNRELLEQFYKRIESYAEQASDRTLRGFVTELDLELKAGEEGPIKFDPNSGPESLKVMTIHSAKGLEFKFVFIINLVDQRFPTRAKRDAIELPEALVKDILPEGDFHLQEERRLFYVALTRAKTHLYLSWGRDYGGAKQKKPSLFLTETKLVPSEAVNRATGKVVFTKPPTSSRKAVYKELPTYFSFSQISQFTHCPLEYKYRYYLKLPLPGTAQLSFGITIHAVFQKYLETFQQRLSQPQQDLFSKETKVDLPPLELLQKLYQDEWIDDWYANAEQKEKYRQRGQDALKAFYDYSVANVPAPELIEQKFNFKLGDKDQYTFSGKIDRADKTAAGLDVIDYKTSERVPKKPASSDLDQLRIYQWAAQDFFKKPVGQLRYWYVVPNQFVKVEPASEKDITAMQTRLLESIEAIREAVKYDSFAELHKKSPAHECNLSDLL